MQIQSNQRNVEMSGFEGQTKKFSIKNSPMAFRILSDKLYSDKPLAIIRELACNAFDAHVAAGNQKIPFQVHLPNSFEPYFFIRDFGTGLPEEKVMQLYTTYFESTKSDSNEFVGALGLGSKSPFSYVDQFSVTSFYNGTQTEYLAFIDSDGTPSIKKVFETPIDSLDIANGLKIQVMVEASDFDVFAERANRVFHRFPVAPTITGNRKVDLTRVKYVIEGPNYKLRDEKINGYYTSYGASRGEHNACYAVQGTVAYPIKASLITIPKTPKQNNLLQYMPVDIIFNIGDLDIAPSREELSYDKRTQQNILDALDKVIAHVPAFAADILSKAKTEWEAKLLYRAWMNNGNAQSKFMRDVLEGKLMWNNKKIDNHHIKAYCYDHDKATQTKLSIFSSNSYYEDNEEKKKAFADHNIESWGHCCYYDHYKIKSNPDSRSKSVPTVTYEPKIDVGDNTEIILCDDPKRERKLAKFLSHNFGGQSKDVYVFKVEPVHHQKIIDQLGGYPNVKLLSELDDLPVVPIDPNAVVKKKDIRKLYKVDGVDTYLSTAPLKLSETEHDVEEGGYFMVLYNKNIVHPGDEFKDFSEGSPKVAGDANTLITQAISMGLLKDANGNDIKLFAFNSSHRHLAKKNSNWVNIWDFIKTKLVKAQLDPVIKSDMMNLAIHKIMVEKHNTYSNFINFEKELKGLKLNKANSKFKELHEQILKVARSVEVLAAKANNVVEYKLANISTYNMFKPDVPLMFASAKNLLGTKEYENFPKVEDFIKKFGDNIINNYPLLPKLLEMFNPSTADHNTEGDKNQKRLAHYINVCDASPTLTSNAFK